MLYTQIQGKEDDGVAQIFNLLYRRLAVGRVLAGLRTLGLADVPQNAILRYSRLKICATSSATYQARDVAGVRNQPALWRTLAWFLACLALSVLAPQSGGVGLDSTGNVDGVLTWRLGDLAPGSSAREVVLFVFDDSFEKAAQRLRQARTEFQSAPELTQPGQEPQPVIWLKNGVTDFALQSPGHFFWEGDRQSFSSAAGGQLSRFGYYLHYSLDGDKRAGTSISNRRELENLRVIEPVHALGDKQAVGSLETADGALRLRVRALMGQGAVAAVEFLITNAGDRPIGALRLSAYANLEAAHDHENDYGGLDTRSEALAVMDVATGQCVLMAGLHRPESGWSGVWASENALRDGTGVAFSQWRSFSGIPADLKKAFAAKRGGIYDEYAPAPPVEPKEPETRRLTAAEAEAVLQRDWLFQAEGKPLVERTRQEIRWARELARRMALGSSAPNFSRELEELDFLEGKLERQEPSSPSRDPVGSSRREEAHVSSPESQSLLTSAATVDGSKAPPSALAQARPDPPAAVDEAARRDLYFAVRAVKRRIQFKNPAVDFSQVLFIDNPYPAGREWPHQVRHRNGMMAVPGGRLLVLDGLSPAGKLRKLAPEEPASFWRPDLSFDARRVLFCMKRHDEKSFHLFEINLDGSGLRQITDGPYDDLDPIYLPSGQIVFSTTRGNTYIRCMPYTYSYILGRCDADGRNLYLISGASEPEWLPTLLNDGRILFSRWDYIDKALWRIESLWTCRQDGTAVETFWGNQSVWPDHQTEARPIPESNRIIFTGLAHHDWFAGSIGIIDPTQGRNFPQGLTKVTADVAWPECGTPPVDPIEAADYHTSGKFDAYKSPFPLSEEDFLVSARRDGQFRLYLMDVHGNRELIYEGAHHIWHALPVKPRTPPPRHSDLVTWPGVGPDRGSVEPGVFFSANVCQGVPELSVSQVKSLRVLQMDHKTYSLWTRDGRYSGPAVSALQDDGVKRILGTVPVAPDGSVHFKVPPGVVLYFQLLDKHQRALQTMRSSTGVMPGERRGCVGCHEQHTTTPLNDLGLAAQREPSDLTPPPWGTASISYERLVQPVLDQYCGSCHQGEGEGRSSLDLTLRRGSGVFKEPYLTLVGPIGIGLNKKPHQPGIAGAIMCENFEMSDPESYVTLRPMKHLSYTSRLIELCRSGQHYDVKLDSASLLTLIGWVDANCPYRGDEDIRQIPDPEFAGVENLPIRPRTKTAPAVNRP